MAFTFIKKFANKYFIFTVCTGCRVPNKADLLIPSSAGQGTENITKMVRKHNKNKNRERSLTDYRQNRLSLGEFV